MLKKGRGEEERRQESRREKAIVQKGRGERARKGRGERREKTRK